MTVPLVSVVMPTRNRATFLHRAIRSVLAQTETRIELIVVDDASSDETQEIVAQYVRADSRVKGVRNEIAAGGGGARNIGIRSGSSKWVAFIDDDDEWLPEKIERQLALLARNPSAIACSCGFEQHFPSGKVRAIHLQDCPTLQDLLVGSVLGGASMCLCLRATLEEIGGYDTSLRSGQDWDVWTRLREQGGIVVCREVLVRYQAHDGPRISNNMASQYQGARRFYFKHRSKMSKPTRRIRIAYACFIMSRQLTRTLKARLKYLLLAFRHAPMRTGVSYVVSSAPRLVADVISVGRGR
jgi:glycosyltransferase involved in cell wall biosynthesis